MKTSFFSKSVLRIAVLSASTLGLGLCLAGRAQAEEHRVSSPLFSCNMSFHAAGKSIYLGLGYTEVHGEGTVSCLDFVTGATQHIPIRVKARGPGAGLGVTGLAISGGAVGVGVAKGPEALLGHYLMVRGNAAVGIGAGIGPALRLSNGAVNIDISIQAESGLGAGVDILWIDIEQAGDKRIDPAPQPLIEEIADNKKPTARQSSQIVYVEENESIEIVDRKGRVLQVIQLQRKP